MFVRGDEGKRGEAAKYSTYIRLCRLTVVYDEGLWKWA